MVSDNTLPAEDLRRLIQTAQQGDPSAFRQLFELYRHRVFTIASYCLSDRVAAEDAVQSIFLKIHQGLPGFRFEASLDTWIYRIAVNQCRNYQRRRGAQFVPLEALLGSSGEMVDIPPPDQLRANRQRQEILRQAVLALSPKAREVIVLKYVEGLSYEEIATVLQCAPGTVASRLNRALTELESRLRPLKGIL